MSDLKWFWWLWVMLPLAIVAALYRRAIELLRRCRRGDEWAFDSDAGTVTHNGRLTAHLRDIKKVQFESFTGDNRNAYDSNIYTLRVLLADGSNIKLACLYNERPVALLADEVAALLGMRVEKEYRSVWDRPGIQSLGLTQLQRDSEIESEDAARRLGGAAPEDHELGSGKRP